MKKLIVLLTAAMATIALSGLSPAQAADSKLIKVISRNLKGNADGDALGAVYNKIDNWRPDAVTLQELCRDDYKDFRERYPNWATRFTAQMAGGSAGGAAIRSCDGEDIGNMIASPTYFTQTEATPLIYQNGSNPGHHAGRDWKLLCANTMSNRDRRYRLCTAHIHPVGSPTTFPNYVDESTATAKQHRTWMAINIKNELRDDWIKPKGKRVVVTGDFNAWPASDTMDRLYSFDSGGGDFVEADQTEYGTQSNPDRSGEPTHGFNPGSKIDYVFYSAAHAEPFMDLEVVNDSLSDHALLLGKAWLE